ncbi:MAG: phosphate ABC transporter permease family protein, partial [Pseudomonadota bacterium]
MLPLTLLAIVLMSLVAFAVGRSHAVACAEGKIASLHSRPSYHGLYMLLWVLLAGIGVFVVADIAFSGLFRNIVMSAIAAEAPSLQPIQMQLVYNDAVKLATGGVASATDELRTMISELYSGYENWRVILICAGGFGAALLAFGITYRQLSREFRARNRAERILRSMLWTAATIAILTTIGIVLSLIGETLVFFSKIGWDVPAFLFGTTWAPLSGVQAGALDPTKVGAIPLFVGTLMITIIAMCVAVPVGLFAAIYLADFASKKTRSWAKPLLEILAGVPTVVYGYFAVVTVAPALRDFGASIGLSIASESALAAGVVMGIMIIPFISSLSDDVINSVPQSLRDGSYGLGA